MKLTLSNIFLLLMASAVMGSGIGYSKLYLYHLVFICLLCCWAYYSIFNRQNTFSWPRNRYIYFLAFLFLWYTMSMAWSIEPLYALNYLYYLFVGISLVFLICSYCNTKERYLKTFKIISIYFIAALILALMESFTPIRLPTSPYSDYAVLFDRKGTDFTEFESDVQALIKSAPTAFWGNPNNLAVAMVLLVPFFLLNEKKSIKIGGSLAVLLIIIMAGSRGVFIAFLFVLFIFIILKGIRFWLPLLASLIVSSLLLVGNIDALKSSDNKRVSELAMTGEILFEYLFEDSDSEASIGSRQKLIKNGLDALWKTGGLGVGGGGSVAVQEQSGGVTGKLLSMHNFWVEMLVDAGVIVFLLFTIWYAAIAYKLLKIYKSTEFYFFKYQSGSLFIALLAFAIAAVSASSVIYFFPMWLMFGLAIALISIYTKEISHSRQSSSCHKPLGA